MKFINRFIALLLCIVMISAFACLSVSAETLYTVGSWVYHKINNSTEFEVYNYTGEKASVTTPYSHNLLYITSIGSNAFSENLALQKMTLSQYITAVQSYAYLNCTNLSTVIFKGSEVTKIAQGAFSGCSSLTDINIEDTKIDKVYYNTFMNCKSLTEVTLPDTVTTIEENAFAYCDNLKKIVIPATVTSIDGEAFSGSDNVVIHCYENSLAHRYAVNNNIPYVLLDAKETYLLGDADNDGVVTVLDATLIQLVLASKTEKIDGFDTRADVDSDGVVSILDATSVQQYMAGLLADSNIGKVYEY